MPKLSEVAEINPGVDRSAINDLSEAVSFVPMASVSEVQGAITSEEERLVADVLKGFTAFQDRDVLVAKITPCFENAKIAHARISKRLGFGSTEFHVIRPSAGVLDDRYLFHFLRQPVVREEGERRMTGSAGQKRVPKDFLESLDIPVPPLVEQRRIAAILDKADALRAKRREAIAKLDQLLQSVFLDMFGDPVSNPRGICTIALGNLIGLRTGKLDANASSEDGEYPFFTCARKPLRISTYSYDCECVLVAGNGDLNVKKYSGKFDAYQRTYILESVDKSRLTTNYLFHFLDAYLDELRKQSIGGIIKYIKKGNLTEAMIPLPTAKEQNNFNRICDEISLRRTRLEAAQTASQRLFEVLQSRAFAGTL